MITLVRRIATVVLFGVLALAYVHPGEVALFERRTDVVLSDGTDPATLPYQYTIVRDISRTNPRHLLYGAVPTTTLAAPEAFGLWIPWMERTVVVAFAPFFPIEQLSTVLVVILLIANAVVMYALGRRLGWSRSLSIAIAIGFAFSATTRARAKVHMALAGIYHLPLVFLGLVSAAKGKSWKSIAAAAACFVGAVTVAHYYIVTLAFLGPFLVLYLLILAGGRREWPRAARRLTIAALPAVMLLGWSVLEPLPPEFVQPGATVRPATGDVEGGGPHLFLTMFAARPVDYVTGDVGIGSADWNPARARLTKAVEAESRAATIHERANGIRWMLWALALAGVVTAFAPRFRGQWPPPARNEVLVLTAFGAFSFWLSLAPNGMVPQLSPSYWLYSLVPQIRVPSRAGVCVQFAVAMLAGLFVHHVIEPRSRFRGLAAAAVLPLLMIAEFPPFLQAMPMAPVNPPYAALQNEPCGPGLRFPYVSGSLNLRAYYGFLQRMRGSHCQILNTAAPSPRNDFLFAAIPDPQNIESLESSNQVMKNLSILAACVPMTWVVFDEHVPAPVQQEWCGSRNWRLTSDGVCRAPTLAGPIVRKPEECR